MQRYILISSLVLLAACTSSTTTEDNTAKTRSAVVQCDAVDVTAGSFCAKPFGKPEDECAKLGLDWAGVKDEGTGSSVSSTQDAFAAIVKGGNGGKDGGCSKGESSYRVYVGVKIGDALQTGNNTGVSHVTYCTCAASPPPQPVCGNGIVEDGEQCDDGNGSNDDQCTTRCTIPEPPSPPESVCGNGQVESGEDCDDGNVTDGDGCSSVCTVEEPSPPPAVCGDGNLEGSEQCDDGNTTDGDGCSSNCTVEPPPVEECDGGDCGVLS